LVFCVLLWVFVCVFVVVGLGVVGGGGGGGGPPPARCVCKLLFAGPKVRSKTRVGYTNAERMETHWWVCKPAGGLAGLYRVGRIYRKVKKVK
jgi:hypothetical protein